MAEFLEVTAEPVRCRSLEFLRQQGSTGGIKLPRNTSPAKFAIAQSLGPVELVDTNPSQEFFKIPIIEDPVTQSYMREAQIAALDSTCWTRKVGCVVVNDENTIVARSYSGPVVPGQDCNGLSISSEEVRTLLKEGEWLNFCQGIHDVERAVAIAGREGPAVGWMRWFLSVEPCDRCADALIFVRAKEVFFTAGKIDQARYYDSEGLVRLNKVGIPTYYVRMPEDE